MPGKVKYVDKLQTILDVRILKSFSKTLQPPEAEEDRAVDPDPSLLSPGNEYRHRHRKQAKLLHALHRPPAPRPRHPSPLP